MVRSVSPTVNTSSLWKRMLQSWELYVFLIPALLYLVIFAYGPMGGVVIAFKDYKPYKGIFGSDWVGLKHFTRFFKMNNFWAMMRNTITLSLYGLVVGFPLPIILATLLNTSPYPRFKKAVQTITYAPHFISLVIVVGMLRVLFSPNYGLVGNLLRQTGALHGPLMMLTQPAAFKHLYVWSGIWQGIGWSSIIYLGALTGVDPALHESAVIDGANKLQRILHIDLPGIVPTMVVLLIMRCGSILDVGFEKVFLMQNSLNISQSEIISTYIYKQGIQNTQYSFSTAVGLFNSVINFAILISANVLSKSMGENALW
ncbi:sugar ABC transporter permease [Clostridia bacterium]|nr:sugar ABC transporter permease [Clostridia bacterium]